MERSIVCVLNAMLDDAGVTRENVKKRKETATEIYKKFNENDCARRTVYCAVTNQTCILFARQLYNFTQHDNVEVEQKQKI